MSRSPAFSLRVELAIFIDSAPPPYVRRVPGASGESYESTFPRSVGHKITETPSWRTIRLRTYVRTHEGSTFIESLPRAARLASHPCIYARTYVRTYVVVLGLVWFWERARVQKNLCALALASWLLLLWPGGPQPSTPGFDPARQGQRLGTRALAKGEFSGQG